MEKVSISGKVKLSEHFTLGELCRSKSHPEVYNIPSRMAIENLKRLCTWLHFAVRQKGNRRKIAFIG